MLYRLSYFIKLNSTRLSNFNGPFLRGYIAALIYLLAPWPSAAAVVAVKIESRADVLQGKPFGAAGAYEKIEGLVTFAFDPESIANEKIVDLNLAPFNMDHHVKATANFMVLQPKDPGKARGLGILEVSNRGGKALLPYFNAGVYTNSPEQEQDFGDGLLMRQGYTLMWVGWQWDVPATPKALRLLVPIAKQGMEPISGLVRADWVLDKDETTLPLAHRNHQTYLATDPDHADNVMTARDGRDGPRNVVPREQWRFVTKAVDGNTQGWSHVSKDGGFNANKIYELVYRSQNPRVVGLGFAAVRDFMSFAKFDSGSPFRVTQGMAFGVSQTGRFLRHFLYQGFNRDELGRQVFDGMFIHAAGAGRGSFNHRFAQPSRDGHRYSAFDYPTDLFPFTSAPQLDVETGVTSGLLPKSHLPKIFYTNSGYEYWGRAASLIHTTPDGKKDVEPLANERIFHLASGQHFVVPFPPKDKLPDSQAYLGNPLDYLVNLRALMLRLGDWVQAGREPPQSAYPKVAEGMLVEPIPQKGTQVSTGFPAISGLTAARLANLAARLDFGPRWKQGIIDQEPPVRGEAFATLVPKVDEFGNELGGIRNVEIVAPLATYTPWSLRTGLPGPQDELRDFFGTWLPFAKDDNARGDDPRPSVSALYKNKDEYLARAKQATKELVERGYLLEEDTPRVMERAEKTWDEIAR